MPDAPRRRVLVTGAAGVIGGVVRGHLGEHFDLSYLTRSQAPFPSHVGDVANLAAIEPAFGGVDTVVHLAGASSVESGWEEVRDSNIIGTYNVFEAARLARVRRVVFASSNHAIGMYEVDEAPELYRQRDRDVYDETVAVRPDSLYGVSKVFGEAVGRLYADRFGLEVVCLRIGMVRADDDPDRVAPGRPFEPLPELTPEEGRARARAVWLSHRDCAELVRSAIEAPVRWAVVYGVSNNAGRFWDLDSARRLLGFVPRDGARA